MVDSHQYGMFVLNAFLEEQVTGPDGLRQIWLLAEDRQGTPWDEILAEGTGESAAELWAGFTAAYGNGVLAQSADYAEAAQQGTLGEGVGGNVAYLGTDYWAVAEDGEVTLLVEEGDAAVLGGAGGTGQTISVQAGEVLAVTGLVADGFASYTLTLEGEGGGAGDDGDGGSGGGSGLPPDEGEEEKTTSCAAGTAPWAVGLLVLPLVVARRRYPRGV
jgi:hypothetical protein